MLRKGSRLSGGLLAAAVALVMALAVAAPQAQAAAATPQWVLTAVPRATNLVPDSPRNQVEQLTVAATGGTFTITIEYGGGSHTSNPLPYDATATEVQEAMNSLGEGWTIAVSGGPGGSSPYRIEWGGYSAHASLELRGVSDRVDSSGLTGGAHTATLEALVTGVAPTELVLTATNVSDIATDGALVTLEDMLPAGVTATGIEGLDLFRKAVLTCAAPPTVSCSYSGTVDPGDSIVVLVTLAVGSGLPASVANSAKIFGGGSEPAEASTPLTVSGAPDVFGVSKGSLVTTLSSYQAGGHPNITTSFALNTKEGGEPVATPRDVRFDLPVGFVGNTVGLPRCPMHDVMLQGEGEFLCPAGSMVGIAIVNLREDPAGSVTPVFNIAPAPGEPAAFGFDASAVPVRLDTTVLSNGNDGVRVVASSLNEAEPATGSTITIWGVPADHDGPGPDETGFSYFGGDTFGAPSTAPRVALLTAPSQCTESLAAVMQVDSWTEPGNFVGSEHLGLGSMTGCDQLRISSSFSMVPDTLEAGAPAGYHFHLNVPQITDPSGLGTPNVKNVSLTLPVGTVVNPSAAWGLQACSNAQFYGPDHPSEEPAQLAGCPRAAQVGTVRIKTPALEEGLEGQVYLAQPECDPCTPADAEGGKMIRLFVQAVSEGEGGIVIKLEGHGRIDQSTGQITTTFEDNPQLPFSEFQLTFGGGPRAVLANPRTCGPAVSSMDLTPWSTPTTPDVTPSYTFDIDENCFGPRFAPSFKTGMPNIQAGAHGEFTLAFGREDDDEFLGGISVRTPEGLLGNLAGIPLCKEAEAIAGTCAAESQIGTVEALTGPGANPFLVSGGHVYLTEGYAGSQFGLSIVVPAVAGPYTLGGLNGLDQQADSGTVVVRSQIFVDPHTAQLTVTSGPLPSMLDGIPLQLKAVNVRINRPGFMFNPTSCERKQIAGQLAAVEGMSASVTSPFQVANCAALKFAPQFSVSTSGKTSKANGASLTAKVSYPNAPQGAYANIARVKVDLPKQLPSRLTTLQKACTSTQFEANPADCPSASKVGFAKVSTPLLPVPLEGPAIFVSHGDEAFPSLTMVLQGYGVTVDLVGTTFISKAGITSTTFKTVPDVPFNTFTLTLAQGQYSALAANLPEKDHGNLCGQTLAMPTEFVAQNGAVIHQKTPITIEGCSTSLSFASSIKKRTLTLAVYAPAAGKLTAGGKGLTTVSKTTTGQEDVTITLRQKRTGKFKAAVKVVFKPSKGKMQSKSVKLTFKE